MSVEREGSTLSVELHPLNRKIDERSSDAPANGSDDCCVDFDDLVAVTNTAAPTTSTSTNIFHARRLLYISHFFAQWSETSWQFGLASFLAAVTQYESLVLVSTYGFTLGLAVVLTGGRLGRWIDTTPHSRLTTARWLIGMENLSVLLATAFCYVLLSAPQPEGSRPDTTTTANGTPNWLQRHFDSVPHDPVSVVALVAIHILGATAQVMDQGFLVAIERDWVVVLSRSAAQSLTTETRIDDSGGSGDGVERIFSQWLSDTNVAMKQIDLSCKFAAPAVAGLLIPFWASGDDFRLACLAIGATNVASLVAEYYCTARIYQLIPALAVISDGGNAPNPFDDEDDDQTSEEAVGAPFATEKQSKSSKWSAWIPTGLGVYMQQSSALGGLGLAVLYMNSLTFGNGIMTAYLLHKGMKLEAVGALRGLASAIGLVATVAYRISIQWLSLEATGLWSIIYQVVFLGMTVASILRIANVVLALSLLIAGICLSRIGLWVFDIAMTQIQQQEIPGPIRGQVGGVQQSLNAFFNLLGFSIGIFFPNTKDFSIFVLAGFLSVCFAAFLFTFGVYLPRRSRL